jgi:PhoH-like ATPase
VTNTNRKLFIIDTSVLLYDSKSIHSFVGNDVVIPMIVLEELDRFKDKQSEVGNNAREVNRFLDSLRELGHLYEWIQIPETDIRITVKPSSLNLATSELPIELRNETGDNKILDTALNIGKAYSGVYEKIIVVTKDINLRIKCDSLGLLAEDYYSDIPTSIKDGSPAYTGITQVILEPEAISNYYQYNDMPLSYLPVHQRHTLLSNQLVVGTSSDGKSMIGIVKGKKITRLRNDLDKSVKIEGRSKEQKAAIHLLCDDRIPLVSLTGLAGSGKTFLSLVTAMSKCYFEKTYSRIIITRSLEPVGRDIGFLPGTLEEKMAPWLSPFMDNFRNAFSDLSLFEMMKKKGQIEVSPISHIRGRSFKDSFIIVDECQNLTIHELKTIITRAGENVKLVLLGDTDQIDTPYLNKHNNGLSIVIEKLKGQEMFGHIHLDKGERSPLATMGSKLL